MNAISCRFSDVADGESFWYDSDSSLIEYVKIPLNKARNMMTGDLEVFESISIVWQYDSNLDLKAA
jgi:hypothetical protein